VCGGTIPKLEKKGAFYSTQNNRKDGYKATIWSNKASFHQIIHTKLANKVIKGVYIYTKDMLNKIRCFSYFQFCCKKKRCPPVSFSYIYITQCSVKSDDHASAWTDHTCIYNL